MGFKPTDVPHEVIVGEAKRAYKITHDFYLNSKATHILIRQGVRE